MKKTFKILSFLSLITLLLGSFSFVKAANVTCSSLGTVAVVYPDSLAGILSRLCGGVFVVGVIAVVLGFIISGIFYVKSAGDPSGFKTANQFLIYTLVGATVIFAAAVFLEFGRYISGIQ